MGSFCGCPEKMPGGLPVRVWFWGFLITNYSLIYPQTLFKVLRPHRWTLKPHLAAKWSLSHISQGYLRSEVCDSYVHVVPYLSVQLVLALDFALVEANSSVLLRYGSYPILSSLFLDYSGSWGSIQAHPLSAACLIIRRMPYFYLDVTLCSCFRP